MRGLALLLVVLAGCVTPAGNDAAGALANVAMASAVGAARVHEGDCFSPCGPGTVCNLKTHVCDTLPCHGTCTEHEVCDNSGPIEHCVPEADLAVSKAPPAGPPPVVQPGFAVPMSSAPPSSPSHPDVPAATP